MAVKLFHLYPWEMLFSKAANHLVYFSKAPAYVKLATQRLSVQHMVQVIQTECPLPGKQKAQYICSSMLLQHVAAYTFC